MILQSLCDYYERKPDLPRLGFETKGVPFVIELDSAGQIIQIEDTRSIEGKKRIPQNFLVPQGEKRASGIAANLLWDNAEYVLGVTSRGKPDRVRQQHAAFRVRLEKFSFIADVGLKAVTLFFNTSNKARLEADMLWPEILESNAILTFRLQGDRELVCQRPAIRDALGKNTGGAAAQITCLISGEPDSFERLHTAIKGVRDAQTSGANIVSFNKDAFNSFGKEQGANAPVGKRAAFAYTTALNYLLSKGSKQRIQVGDASTVFWSETQTQLEDIFADLFDEPPKDDPSKQTRAIEALFKSPVTGAFTNDSNIRFYVLGLAPNAARVSIRFWQIGTIAEMSARIRQHFDDLQIIHAGFEKPHLSLFRLLLSTATQGKSDNITPNLAGEFMRSILSGLPYPQSLLQSAIRRLRAEREVNYPRAALIKACLNRQMRYLQSQEKEVKVSLDENNSNPGYRIGRLFAVLEKVQEEAVNPGATIRDRFYGAASCTPGTVFANLMKLKNHHLAKLGEGRKRYFEKLIGQIMSKIIDFPSHLILADQGRFAIGYYHQRQAFFTKSASTSSNNQGE
ncbi:CRISPR-associated protein, Csd1 family [Nitrosospira sp. Nsp18]|uniref:type I-C CRISPR-associated protein Cas8c/Csd1 n=1 Tax=Nitrosospira sp. Nsp18 TaxID=1855334 RepID=UPI00088B0FC1|nr:type I-C CRISPR-associated protein Cas8c/Csd1 [Nitrosospira sp. Nsp18]SDA26110.1 CRISPR-associated protein, Csd1 family [Nitrosospira sp. Nsp18]